MTYKIEITTKYITKDITSDVDIGFSTLEKLDESLDIGTLEIPFSTKKETYDIWDIIDITINNELVSSYRIGGDNVSLVSKNPLIYSHSLSLVEHTKILERTIVTGFTFTQPIDLTEPKKSLYDLVNSLRLTQPLELNSLYLSTRLFTISNSLRTFLDGIESPEFTWNNMTLRECIDDVATYVNAIARLDRYSSLTFDFINDLHDIISYETGVNNKSLYQNMDMYATEMTVDALNVVNDNQENVDVETYPSDSQYASHRSTGFFLDPLKMYIPTPKPIYEIKELNWKGNITVLPNPLYPIYGTSTIYSGSLDVDVTDRVKEYEAWNILDADKEVNIFNYLPSKAFDERLDPTKFYKSNTIYYTYKEQNITDNYTTDIWDSVLAVDNALKCSIYYKLVSDGIITDEDNGWYGLLITFDDDELDYLWNVKYIPIIKSLRMSIERENLEDIDKQTSLLSNQQSRIVNLENFTNNVQSRINRIGNRELEIENRVVDINDAYNVGDYTEDFFIITEKELIFYKDYIHCKYSLSKDFNRISKFLSVNSEIRQYEIGETDRTLERDLLYKEYVEIDAVNSGNGENSSEVITDLGIETFIETFNSSSSKLCSKVCISIPKDEYGDTLVENIQDDGSTIVPLGLLSPFSSNGANKNLMFDLEFKENKSSGNWVQTLDNTSGDPVEQNANNFARYTDEKGELTRLQLLIYEDLADVGTIANQLEMARLLPNVSVSPSNLLFNFELYVLKDRRSILKVMFQEQLLAKNNRRLIIGNQLAKRNRLITDNAPTNFYVYVYENNQFGILDNKTPINGSLYGGLLVNSSDITIDTTNQKVTFTSSQITSSLSSWCITDENRNLLFAVNQDGTLLNVLTFDFNNKRTDLYEIVKRTVKLANINISSTASINMIVVTEENRTVSFNTSATTSLTLTTREALNYSVSLSNQATTEVSLIISGTLDQIVSLSNQATSSLTLTTREEINNLVSFDNEATTSLLTIITTGLNQIVSFSNETTASISGTFVAEEFPVEWVETTEQTPTTDECILISDVGNIKVESEFVCVYNSTGSQYNAAVDLTTTIPACNYDIPTSYTICFYDITVPTWRCGDYVAEQETEDTYYECQLK